MSGIVGSKTKNFTDIDSNKTKPVIDKLTNLITDKSLDKKSSKKALTQIQD